MSTRTSKCTWISLTRPNPAARVRLFCFPYAGGAAGIYRTWQKVFPPSVDVCAVQPPGRGERLGERPFTQIKPLVEAAAEALRPFFDKPFAFFGHSMGALIGYELAHLLRRERAAGPSHLFVSGHSAPHLRNRQVISYNLPEAEFIEELRRLDGTPKEVFEHPELLTLMIPLLRADFEICETYPISDEPPLDCPVVAFGGEQDLEVPRDRIAAWRERTSGPFKMHMLRGDHFFIHTEERTIIREVALELGATSVA